jgi:ABC-2 type transport system ATP-binding protein
MKHIMVRAKYLFMAHPVLEVSNLTKQYGKYNAVDQLSFSLSKGEVFGFLGPNGAGKTTTIRMLLNLVKPTSGEIYLFGENIAAKPEHVLSNVGALIEYPSFQPYLSGRNNLIVVGGYTGNVSKQRVDEVLGMVGLGKRGDDVFSSYSLGMKQRLGIGAAILMDPELIILDEPGNGLDPAGIVEVRTLIKHLADAGKTILISSHILAEIKQVATRIGIIRSGSFIAVGKTNEILSSTSRWEIKSQDKKKTMDLLGALSSKDKMRLENDWIVIDKPELSGEAIIQTLTKGGIYPEEVKRTEEDLENIFLTLTEREAGL